MANIDLVKKKAEIASISFEKKGITKIPTMRVIADLDVSGSMESMYRKGVVERAFEKLLGLALKFDDNGEIETFAFDTNSYMLPVATANDYGSYVTENITRKFGNYGGGTSYAKPIKANLDLAFGESPGKGLFGGLFGRKPAAPSSNDPVLVLFFTDGEAGDVDEASRLIEGARGKPIYFHLIGIGTSTFRGLQKLADAYDNCGFISMKSIDVTDEQLYDQLASPEFITFLKQHGAA